MKYDGYTVGPNLRQLRKDKKLSLYQVSEKTGLSQSSITQVEQGGRNLSMKSLYLLMDVYGFIDDNRTLYVLCSDEKEQEANYFAACLLMPEDRVRKFYDIELNNIDPSELSAYDIAKMMSEFSSSFEMVLNRLDDIKLIDAVQKTRLNSEKNEMRVGNLLRVIGGNCRLNEVSNIIRLPYEYLDYVIYNYNHNAIPIETLEKVLEAYQLTIEDISDKLIIPKEEEDSDLDELIGGIEE
ncbi:MAG TPA: ImmA/IrrE family metallo-endopeptidase [Clostridiales bacterium]|jgi:transcriptional regulator with XRE-family HTH domain|nr:ImmA/IrrE family metallo-endopeptidase [Clostridiales bacterium]